jgi:hypothetical protein
MGTLMVARYTYTYAPPSQADITAAQSAIAAALDTAINEVTGAGSASRFLRLLYDGVGPVSGGIAGFEVINNQGSLTVRIGEAVIDLAGGAAVNFAATSIAATVLGSTPVGVLAIGIAAYSSLIYSRYEGAVSEVFDAIFGTGDQNFELKQSGGEALLGAFYPDGIGAGLPVGLLGPGDVWLDVSAQARLALEFFGDVAGGSGAVELTGHSLGGLNLSGNAPAMAAT